jgi:hypothetical protein
MTKEFPSTNAQKKPMDGLALKIISSFGLRHSFGIRISSFVIPWNGMV